MEHHMNSQPMIAGHNIVVEIDERKFAESKYEPGIDIEGFCFFGGIERVRKTFMVPLLC